MKKLNGVKNMTVYCDSEWCDFKRQSTKPPLLRCPICGNYIRRIEEDREWQPLFAMWACTNGYPIGAKNYSLPRWVFENRKQEAWERFKAAIQDYEAIGPPPSTGDFDQAADFWREKTGLIELLIEALNTVPINFGNASKKDAENFLTKDPKVRDLMAGYFSYWKRKGIIN